MNDGTQPYNLIIGTYVFSSDDYPDTLTIGRKMNNVVMRLSDGSRFLQQFGSETDDIAFKGNFMYGDAVSRAQQLDRIFLLRQPVQFTCDFYSAQVTITQYNYTVHHPQYVEYTITMYVNDDIPYYISNSPANTLTNNSQVAQTAVAASGVPGALNQAQIVTNIVTGKFGP